MLWRWSGIGLTVVVLGVSGPVWALDPPTDSGAGSPPPQGSLGGGMTGGRPMNQSTVSMMLADHHQMMGQMMSMMGQMALMLKAEAQSPQTKAQADQLLAQAEQMMTQHRAMMDGSP